jgi:ProP effector
MSTNTNPETEISFLLESYPLAFLKGTPKPLKVGIRDDLVSRGLSKSQANAGLKAYCRRGVYRGCLVAGAERIDLDGNAAGVVTDAEAAQATVTPKRTAATPEKPPHK